ncbi:MAG: hypothetical protein H6855_04460 [Rhodospirillales bacterium]|nr:hypothetical protein [Rhodospirillales bacterium]
MLDILSSIGKFFESGSQTAVLKMVKNERMAGSVPVWEAPDSARTAIAGNFEQILAMEPDDGNTGTSQPYTHPSAARLSMAAEASPGKESSPAEKPFGFGDLIDIVNPLQHIPVVNTLYRHLTGDDIRGSGKVLGGALFAGPLGAAGSMVNLIVEHETGKDLPALAMDFLSGNHNAPPVQKSQTDLTAALLAYQQPKQQNPTIAFNS